MLRTHLLKIILTRLSSNKRKGPRIQGGKDSGERQKDNDSNDSLK